MGDGFTVTTADLDRAEDDLLAYRPTEFGETAGARNPDVEAILVPPTAAAVGSFCQAALDVLAEAQRIVPATADGLHATARLYHVADNWPGPR